MLQQILRDMYVDPDILAELDEQQKQTLFCKMREEQVRRWKIWNENLESQETVFPIKTDGDKKSVQFLQGEDGGPWVWVMGEHQNDKTIEEILKEETIGKARKIAEKEAEELRKQVEAQLNEYIELSPQINTNSNSNNNKNIECIDNNESDIYCSVDELKDRIHNKPDNINKNNYSLNHYHHHNNKNNKFNMIDTMDVLQEISLNTQKVAQRVALWEKRLTEERTCEIFQKIQKKQQEVAREAEEAARKQEQLWQEQERKAKQAEQQIREIARRAREEHRLTSNLELDTPYGAISPGVPPGRLAVLDWFKSNEQSKFDETCSWFHGLITRSDAEKLLFDQAYGTFLLRLSEKIWGYAISYRAREKCKHYLVSAIDGDKYQFVGNNQLEHNSLRDLIEYHRLHPLTGGEKLLEPCPRIGQLEELMESTKID